MLAQYPAYVYMLGCQELALAVLVRAKEKVFGSTDYHTHAAKRRFLRRPN